MAVYGIRCALPAVIPLPLPAALLRTATALHKLRSFRSQVSQQNEDGRGRAVQRGGEDDYECEVLIRSRFHFRESDKMGRVTIAWVYLDTLDDLVGQAARRRKLKDHMEGISRFADVSARPAQSTRMEGASGGSLSEEEAQQP